MPTYKILGIYSFDDNLKETTLNEPVILKHENSLYQSIQHLGLCGTTDSRN